MSRIVLAALALAVTTAGCAGEAAEGRPWVKNIQLTGNAHLPAGEIIDHIALAETSWIPFSRRRYLDEVALEVDRQRIVAIYAAHGYFNARVVEVTQVPDGEGAVDVHITVDEGPATEVTALDVRGLEGVPEQLRRSVLDKVPLRRDQPFDHQRYLATKGLIAARLRAEGYAWATVSGVARVDRGRQSAVVELTVAPGPLASFGKISVVGPTTAERRLIAQRSEIDPGQRFDPEKLEASTGRIYELGLFSSVRVDYVHDPSRPDVADVVITVRQSTLNEYRLGVGIGLESDREEAHLRFLYTRRNFLGGLRTLRLRVTPAYVVFPNIVSPTRSGPAVEADVALTQPDFLVDDLALKSTVGYDLGIDYAFRFYGPRGSLGLSYAVARERVVFSLSYNLQRLNFFDTAPAFLDDPSQSRLFFGYTDPYQLAYLDGVVQVDLRDRPFDPRRGAYLAFAVEEGASLLGGGFNYQRLRPDGRIYFPIGHRVVFAGRVEYGALFAQGSGSPITRRFYGGGPDSHRGFGFHRLAEQIGSRSQLPPIPVGGDRLLLAQAEVRIEVARLGGSALGTVLFVDAGDVPERGLALDVRRLHVAVGGGLRYHTVIGTLRGDLGVRVNRLAAVEDDGRHNPDPGSRLAFHLSIGEAF